MGKTYPYIVLSLLLLPIILLAGCIQAPKLSEKLTLEIRVQLPGQVTEPTKAWLCILDKNIAENLKEDYWYFENPSILANCKEGKEHIITYQEARTYQQKGYVYVVMAEYTEDYYRGGDIIYPEDIISHLENGVTYYLELIPVTLVAKYYDIPPVVIDIRGKLEENKVAEGRRVINILLASGERGSLLIKKLIIEPTEYGKQYVTPEYFMKFKIYGYGESIEVADLLDIVKKGRTEVNLPHPLKYPSAITIKPLYVDVLVNKSLPEELDEKPLFKITLIDVRGKEVGTTDISLDII